MASQGSSRGPRPAVVQLHVTGGPSVAPRPPKSRETAIWNLPVVFACENNLYGASTHISKVMRDTNIARRVTAYGIRAEQLDGNDVLAVYEAAQSAVVDCRAGRGPVFLEMLTYRSTGHSRRDPRHYQPKKEQLLWAANDPMVRLGDAIIRAGMAGEARLAAIRAQLEAEFQAAVDAARKAPLPTLDDLTTDVLVP